MYELFLPIGKAYKGFVTYSELLDMSLAEVIILRNGLGEMADKKEYHSFAAKQEDSEMPDAASYIDPNSKLAKTFKPGDWIDEDHNALQDAKSYQAFLAGARGLTANKITVRNQNGAKRLMR